MRRFFEVEACGLAWTGVGHDEPAWYVERIRAAGSRWEAESRLLQALDDPALHDHDFHRVRVVFDHVIAEKGWSR